MTLPLVPDTRDREDAVMTGNHAFVWASAGTGKTHTLTLRALYLLLTLGFPAIYTGDRRQRLRQARSVIESLVLTTFTRKAAAEMQTRLYGLLDLIVSSDSLDDFNQKPEVEKNPLLRKVIESVDARFSRPDFDRLRAGAQALAENASDLQVSTLHSFAVSLLKRSPIESRLSPSLRFGEEEPDLPKELAARIVDRWWQTEASHNLRVITALNTVLQVMPLPQVRKWLEALFEAPWIAEELPALGQVDQSRLPQTARIIDEFARALPITGGTKIAQIVPRFRELAAGVVETGEWLPLTEFLHEHASYFFREPNMGKTFQKVYDAEATSQAVRETFANPQSLLPLLTGACLSSTLASAWGAWLEVTRAFVEWSRTATSREFQAISFEEIIDRAVDLLGNPEVQRREYHRLRAVLVDEFQDTDPKQLELLERLLRKPAGAAHEVIGFFVGDLKQSIYRFRGADIPSIRQFYRHYQQRVSAALPPDEYTLGTSFRSLRPLTDFANDLFERCLPLPKAPLSPYRTDPGFHPVWITARAADGALPANADQHRELTARCALSAVQAHMSRDPETARYRDLLILARDKRSIAPILTALQAAGVPVVASGQLAFEGFIEVQDILNLLIALHNPLDTLAISAVLRSPLVFLSNDEIQRLYHEIPATQLLTSSTPFPNWLPETAAEQLAQLRRLFRQRLEINLTDWLQSIGSLIPKFDYLDPADPDGRAYARIEKVLSDFRRNGITGGTAPLTWLLSHRKMASLQERWDSELGEDVATADESVEAVRVMTVHKAKGLQGKHVIVCGWDAILADAAGRPTPTHKPPAALSAGTTEAGPLRGFRLEWGSLLLTSDQYPQAEITTASLEQEEAKRLAYVAVTRAEDRLTLIESKEITDSLPAALAEMLSEGRQSGQSAFCVFETWHDSPCGAPSTPDHPLMLDRDAYARCWQARRDAYSLSIARRLYHPTEAEALVPSSETASPAERPVHEPSSRLTGQLVHVYLERFLTEEAFSAGHLQELQREFPEAADDPDSLERAEAILFAFYAGRLRDDRGRALRSRVSEARIVGREVPFLASFEGKEWHGVIDLVLERGRRLTAVDYKTTDRLDPLPASYQSQRRLYTEVLRQLFPDRPVVFEFWWLGQREVESPGPRQQDLPFMR